MDSPIDYYRPLAPKPPRRESASFGVGSALCIGVPVLGAAIQNGPLFLIGGLIAPVAGVILGLIGLLRSWRSGAVLVSFNSLALGANALVGIYFSWLLFVHGIC
jgi:hypothetical protein